MSATRGTGVIPQFVPKNPSEQALLTHRPWSGAPPRRRIGLEDRDLRPEGTLWHDQGDLALILAGPILAFAGMLLAAAFCHWIAWQTAGWAAGGYGAVWLTLYLGSLLAGEHQRLSNRVNSGVWTWVRDTLADHPEWLDTVASWRKPDDELRLRDVRAILRAARDDRVLASKPQSRFPPWLLLLMAAAKESVKAAGAFVGLVFLAPLFPFFWGITEIKALWNARGIDLREQQAIDADEAEAVARMAQSRLGSLQSQHALEHVLNPTVVQRKAARL